MKTTTDTAAHDPRARVAKKNSLTAAMYAALADALDAAAGDAAVRVVLIQGDPAIFSAGMSKPSPSMSTQTITRLVRSRIALSVSARRRADIES